MTTETIDRVPATIKKLLKQTMALTGSERRALNYPEPYIVHPRSGHHRQSFIVLHGRGDEGENFGAFLLMYPAGPYKRLQDAFPAAKFIFPTASKRRAVQLGRTVVNQWFDLKSIIEQEKEERLQFEGLRESSQYIHGLLNDEIATVGAENVVLWGLSQGSATSMISLLLWNGPKFAAAVGMCGRVPLKARMERETRGRSLGNARSLLSSSKSDAGLEHSQDSNLGKAVKYLRDELELDNADKNTSNSLLEIPLFLGHGMEDPKVPVRLGEDANRLLGLIGFNVDFRLYDGLGHWYSSAMLQDILNFLEKNKRQAYSKPNRVPGEQEHFAGDRLQAHGINWILEIVG